MKLHVNAGEMQNLPGTWHPRPRHLYSLLFVNTGNGPILEHMEAPSDALDFLRLALLDAIKDYCDDITAVIVDFS